MTCGRIRVESLPQNHQTTYDTATDRNPRISSCDRDRAETQQRKVALQLLDVARGIDEPSMWLIEGRGGAVSRVKDSFPLAVLLLA